MSAVLLWLLAAAVLILPVMLRIWAGDDPDGGREHQRADEPGDPPASA